MLFVECNLNTWKENKEGGQNDSLEYCQLVKLRTKIHASKAITEQ